MIKITRIIAFVILSVLLCEPFPSTAAEKKKIADTKRAETEDALEVKIESTRPRLAVGTGLGITAQIKNKSNSDIYLHEKYITVAPAPELMGWTYINNWYGFFPTETHENGPNYSDHQIKIPAGEQYKVLWYVTTIEQDKGQEEAKAEKSILIKIFRDIGADLRFLFFTPGNYSVSVAAKYWIDPERPPDGKYHTKVDTETLSFDAPQSVILIGAAIGGIIAYFLLPQARRRLIEAHKSANQSVRIMWMKKGFQEIIGVLGAALLSAIVVILLGRLSESQFLIQITIVDFWGAVAMGFIANYAGAEVLKRIIKVPAGNDKDSPKASEQGKKATTPSTNTSNP